MKLRDDIDDKDKKFILYDLQKKEQLEKSSIDLTNLLNESKRLQSEFENEKIDNKSKISEIELLKINFESLEKDNGDKIIELNSLKMLVHH